jgi:hypothetical protein
MTATTRSITVLSTDLVDPTELATSLVPDGADEACRGRPASAPGASVDQGYGAIGRRAAEASGP